MISYNRSRAILKNSKILIGDEIIKSDNCLNRVVSENIFTKVNNPAGNNAAFDGYAIASSDTNPSLECEEDKATCGTAEGQGEIGDLLAAEERDTILRGHRKS